MKKNWNFVHDEAAQANWAPGLREIFDYRDLGIKQGTGGDYVAHVIRKNGKQSSMYNADADFVRSTLPNRLPIHASPAQQFFFNQETLTVETPSQAWSPVQTTRQPNNSAAHSHVPFLGLQLAQVTPTSIGSLDWVATELGNDGVNLLVSMFCKGI